MEGKRLLSVREVAVMLGMGVSSVWRHSKNGTLPRPIRIAGTTRWRLAEIEALIEHNEAD